MQQLDFAELDEHGRLVVVAEDGARYVVPVDDRLRAALRPRRPAAAQGEEAPAATPREVQAMIRAGQTVEEVAAATGWDPERVRRFEGPVLAEREHVVGLARAAHVRAQGRTDGSHTLERRVRERLEARGVPAGTTSWDAARTQAQGPWTVLVAFTAGGRERRAAWHYDVQDRSIEALDDEARWLSEDEQALPGGLAGHPLLGSSHSEDETADLMATMRERRQARGRRTRRTETDRDGDPGGGGRQGGSGHTDEVLPLENLPEPVEAPGEESLPPAAHPRGSAPESPAPVHPVDDGAQHVEELDGGSQQDRDAHDRDAQDRDAQDSGARQDDGQAGPDVPARGRSEARSRRERRRLRMPKLPPAVGGPPPGAQDGGSEGTFARTVDPQEVSFEEFFGPEDDPLGGDDLDRGALSDDEVDTRAAGDADADPEAARDPDADPEAAGDADADPEAAGDVDAGAAREDAAGPAEPGGPAGPGGPADAADEEPAQKPDTTDQEPGQQRRRGRTSVPSWDDIMFGGSDRRRR